MRSESGVRFVCKKGEPRMVAVRIAADALGYHNGHFLSTAIHADITPSEARQLAAELIAAANCATVTPSLVVTEETVDGEPGIVARASG